MDETIAPRVRRIFDMVGVQKMSLGAVAAALNQDGRPSPTEETWSRYVLRSMVLADLYMGT
jgi:hypothetical protein